MNNIIIMKNKSTVIKYQGQQQIKGYILLLANKLNCKEICGTFCSPVVAYYCKN